jgi:hypothetical protein
MQNSFMAAALALVDYFLMTSIISSWEAHMYLTCRTCCCGGGVVWTKTAAAKRESTGGFTCRGCASISNQDYSDDLIVTFLLLKGTSGERHRASPVSRLLITISTQIFVLY